MEAESPSPYVGRYYARAFAGGKEVWKSLKTSLYSVAEAKLSEFLNRHRERVSNGSSGVSPKTTCGEALQSISGTWPMM